MAYVLVSLVVEQLGSIIRQQAEQEIRLVVGVEEEVGKLTSNFLAIQDVLEDAEETQVKEATVKRWLHKLKDVSYDIDDVLDEWRTAIFKLKIEEGKTVKKAAPLLKVCPFIPPPNCFRFNRVALRHDIAHKIKDLNARLNEIAAEKDKYSFRVTNTTTKEVEREMTTSLIDVSKVRSRNMEKSKILDMLLAESSDHQEPFIRVISIVGLGGIGKTTLAQLVYNDYKVKAAGFERKIWVCVSDPFDEIKIAKEILVCLGVNVANLVSLESLLLKIHESIDQKKFLLVMDDVWTEDPKKWEKLKPALFCGSSDSRILVTTRNENVARAMGSTNADIFWLQLLSEEECWSLFGEIAFFGRTTEERENLKDVGRKIANKCRGLPLAAKTLGGLFQLKTSREEWESILDSELWGVEDVEKGLFAPLLLSYYDLPCAIRPCFSYCAVFPKDCKIDKDELIKLWMAQGYLKETQGMEMELIGEIYFKNLVRCSFLQDIVTDRRGITTCKMHDIVHDFAQFLAKNECLIWEANNGGKTRMEMDPSYGKIRHLTTVVADGVPVFDLICNAKVLRSCLVQDEYPRNQCSAEVLCNLLNPLTCLRALNLKYILAAEVPKEIGQQIHLRYLNLSFSGIKALPEELCDLYNLQTLNISVCWKLERLPQGIGKLINLRHLLNDYTGITFMPKGIERLCCLRTLKEFVVSGGGRNNGEASTLGDLEKLNHLQILWIKGLGNAADVGEAEKAKLKDKKHLHSLTLLFDEEEGTTIHDGEVLEALHPPSNLEELALIDYKGTSVLPNWVMSLTKLRRLKLECCSSWDQLPCVGKLASLEFLFIIAAERVRRVGAEFLGIEVDETEVTSSSSFIPFPKLQHLYMCGMKNLEEWIIPTTKIMPCLRSLSLSDCPKLKTLPDPLIRSTTLEELDIENCSILEKHYHKGIREGWGKLTSITS